MDHKRKANGSTAQGAAETDDRAAKRRKASADFDLLKGETRESTTQYGLAFLEQMRRTTDKSGRLIATYFEKLLPKVENKDYYKQIRMPISLELIERKLNDHEFSDLSELESYVKRMIQNAKDFYDKKTEVYDDAERVRKTLSNFMTKNNPAYKLVSGYSAVPTPLPEELEEGSDAEADGEDEEEQAEEDGEGEDEEAEEEAAEDDAGAKSDEDVGRGGSRRRRASRQSARSPKKAAAPVPTSADRSAAKPDHQYEDVPYKGLTFQEAQEKIVEELIRRPDEEDEAYSYFEPFINLPPRSLKDYYQVIKEPLSLRKLQKLVKGIHGRGEKSGVSDYKTWAAFEEASSLLWQNAYYYNEDGSEIANMAKELEDFFFDQLSEAKAVVPEPVQPKIKIKASSSAQDTPPAALPKRITIHVANTRGSSAESPAPATGSGPVASEDKANGIRAPSISQATPAQPGLAQIDKARSVSITGASPSPSVAMKPEDLRQSPAVNGVAQTPNGVVPGGHVGQATPGAPIANGNPPAPVILGPVYDTKYRIPGKGLADALITNLVLRTNPSIPVDRRFHFQIPAHPKEAQQSVTVNVPANHWKMQIIPTIAGFLEQTRPYKLYVIVNGIVLPRGIPVPNDPIEPGGQLFEGQLVPGVNTIQVQIIAGVPKGEKLQNGADVELEKFTILANMLRY